MAKHLYCVWSICGDEYRTTAIDPSLKNNIDIIHELVKADAEEMSFVDGSDKQCWIDQLINDATNIDSQTYCGYSIVCMFVVDEDNIDFIPHY